MDRKIIGFFIIFFGAVLLVGMVYFVFIGNFSFNGIMGMFTKNQENPEFQDDGTVNVPAPVEIENEQIPEADRQPVRIIADDPLENRPGEEGVDEERVVDPLSSTKDDLARMAASFAERFGSFSNHSNFSNIKDLKIYMSSRMKEWADEYILEKTSEAANSSSLYYGITTKAVSKEFKDFDEDAGVAVIKVSTRRRETADSSSKASKVFNQDIVILFVNENGAWKVDDANWQDR